MPEINLIPWNSAPDYDDWGWDDYWTCGQWMEWYDALVAKFGTETARYIWQYAWDKGNQFKFIGGSHLDCRLNAAFADFAEQNGLNVSSVISSVYLGTFEVAESLGEGAKRTATIIAWLIPILLIMAVIAIGYLVFQTIKTGKLPIKT